MSTDHNLPTPPFSDDRICLLIGRIVQQHVNLDATLRTVAYQLVGLGPGTSLVARRRETGTVIEEIRLMLEGSQGGVDERFRGAAMRVIADASSANGRRNEATHDLWTLDGDNLEQGKRPKQGTGFTVQVHTPKADVLATILRQVTDAWLRAQALSRALMLVRPPFPDVVPPPRTDPSGNLDYLLAVMEGKSPDLPTEEERPS